MDIENLLITLEKKMYGPKAGQTGAIGVIVFCDRSGFIMNFGNDVENPVGTLASFNSPEQCHLRLQGLVSA